LALIFDMDGVIVDSNPVHTRAWAVYLERLGVANDRIAERMHGRRNDDIVRDIFGDGLTPQQVEAHGAAKEELYREMMAPELRSRLVPGVAEFLDRHSRLPMALASNAEPLNVEFVLKNSELSRYFQAVVDGHQVERPKPHPEIYLVAAARLRARPEDCLVFEDSPAGIEAARAAGAGVVGISVTGAKLFGADFLTRDFRDPELEKWLRAWLRN
jgi:beta-phosphoglucomutase family hydrolase